MRKLRSGRNRKKPIWLIGILLIGLLGAGYFGFDLESITNPDYNAATEVRAQVEAGTYAVGRIIDGDTVVFRDSNGESYTVRLIGIDAPEDTGQVEPGGPEATAFITELLPIGDQVWLERCINRPKDRFNRVRAYVWLADPTLDSTNATEHMVNAIMLKEGHAEVLVIRGDSSKHEALFRELEANARNSNLGMWATQ